MRLGVRVLCVHEFPSLVGKERHACDFAKMFYDDWTPGHLTSGAANLYKEIAIALKGDEWRKPGLVAVAAALAAGGPAERMPIDLPTDAAIERLGEDASAATDTAQMMIAKHARAMTVRKKIHHASEANEAAEAALKSLVQTV